MAFGGFLAVGLLCRGAHAAGDSVALGPSQPGPLVRMVTLYEGRVEYGGEVYVEHRRQVVSHMLLDGRLVWASARPEGRAVRLWVDLDGDETREADEQWLVPGDETRCIAWPDGSREYCFAASVRKRQLAQYSRLPSNCPASTGTGPRAPCGSISTATGSVARPSRHRAPTAPTSSQAPRGVSGTAP